MAKELILTVVLRREHGGYSSWCPELDIASQGDTLEEARKNLQEAVELYIETIIKDGEVNLLLDKIGLTKEDLKKEVLLSESLTGTFEVPLPV